NQSLNLKIIMHEALKEVMEVTDMKAGWIYIPIDDNSAFKIEAYEGVDEDFIDRIDLLKPGEGFAGRVALSGKPIILEDISDDPRISRGAVLDAGFKALASIPLCYKEKILGVMNIASYETHVFTHDEAEMLISIGNLIGTALENSMLYERLKTHVEELEKTRDLLIRTTTLASLGELSANVAHEINNPLTGILTHISLLVSETPDTNPAKKRLGIIHDETLRIRYIVRNLLDFARQSEPRMETVNITDVIKSTVALVSHAAKISSIDIIEKHPQNIIPKISVDVGQMKQVFLNLFNNAFYAMGKGGALTIEVSADKSYVNIHIKDTGAGIPHEVLPKIFDPFFTTKPGTKGTGLGLSVSYGIVEQHGGVIEVETEINKGSTFIVKLPTKN
ncbi:MAG: ATP-binding protein, partial [Nitrospinota bacterium]